MAVSLSSKASPSHLSLTRGFLNRAQRLALATAYEAMEAAGIVPDATPSTRRDRVGIFYGVTSNDWMETNSAQDIGTDLHSFHT